MALTGDLSDAVDLGRDRDLVERYQSGDLTAFEDLYRRYFDRIRHYCQRRVGSPHEAEELAQEAFVRALHALPRLEGEKKFYPWMTVIAQRLCVDHHRRRGRLDLSRDPQDEATERTADDLHDHLFAQVDRHHLSDALDRLTDRHREILHLREHDALSYAEIAGRLDVPITTVEALLHRARKALRREFLAVSGGRLAGVPVLGLLWRGAGRLKSRVAELSVPAPSAVALPALGGLLALGVAVGPVLDNPDRPDADRPAATVIEADADLVRTSPGAVAPEAAVVTPAPNTAAAATAGAPPDVDVAPPDATAGPVDVWLGPETPDDGYERQPVTGDVGPVAYELDPDEAVNDTADFVDGVVHDAQD